MEENKSGCINLSGSVCIQADLFLYIKICFNEFG